ncbi:Hypothetical predicted protein [Olea europaea subsp. europaea]|uniref:Uncharacterized protein n=1 Tax=Olea europaea subsp. europaea TaxID=158383 RepID=A0A8S0QTG0_OLEEU|nr:Hypothetical predicted protein [Olea europaea subsp. europaea]
MSSGAIQDPKCSKRIGAPKKLRVKGALESGSKNARVRSRGTKNNVQPGAPSIPCPSQVQYSMPSPFSYSQCEGESNALPYQLPSSHVSSMSSSNPLPIWQGNMQPYYHLDFLYMGVVDDLLRLSATGIFPRGFYTSSPPPSAMAGWMSSATYSVPQAGVDGGPSSVVDMPSSRMPYIVAPNPWDAPP